MITLFVALYSLLCLCTTGNPTDIKEFQVKRVKRGDTVTMECNISQAAMKDPKNKNSLAWYRQSFGKVPQFLARPYPGNPGYTFVHGFTDSRFSVTVKDQKFDLNINETREDDGGKYFCGELEGSNLKVTSGTRLQFEGEEMKPCPTPGTLNKNTHSVTHQGSNSRDGEGKGEEMKLCPTSGTLNDTTHSVTHQGSNSTDEEGDFSGGYTVFALIASNIISVIVIVALVGVLLTQKRKDVSSSNHQTPTNQADDEDVLNYAAVNFAKKPSSSRTSRDTSNQDVYAQVKIK